MARLSIVLSAARSSTPGHKFCSSGCNFAGTGDCHGVSCLIRRELPTLWKGGVLPATRAVQIGRTGVWLASAALRAAQLCPMAECDGVGHSRARRVYVQSGP